jgi:hypothetical protein
MMAVDLINLEDYSFGLTSGRYKSEEVVRFFRDVYGPGFSAQDLNRACSILGWRIQRRSGKSDLIDVK